MEEEERNIYKLARRIKKKENSIYNALRSIYDDAGFVAEIRSLYPKLPLLANLRCGLWYSPKFDDVCYFKSTDGHNGNWSFNPSRMNMHVATIAAQFGGCMIVDSTRKGKRFPDSMSKTIPIWACVLNRGIARLSSKPNWDCTLHLPTWISLTEKSSIESLIDNWVQVLLETGTDLIKLANELAKPLRPLWISQNSVIWLNEVPETISLEFTPIFLISSSRPLNAPQRMSDSTSGWTYIPGAADDEESWSKGLTPSIFWNQALDIIDSGPEECNKKVAQLVERERVYWSQRESTISGQHESIISSLTSQNGWSTECLEIQWVGNTGLGVASVQNAMKHQEHLDLTRTSIIDCSGKLDMPGLGDSFLRLEIGSSKMKHYVLQHELFTAVEFAKRMLGEGKRVLIYCRDGEDVSVSVGLAILLSLFNANGEFEVTREIKEVSKWDVRQRLVYVCGYVSNARPSRANLRQVYNFLARKEITED